MSDIAPGTYRAQVESTELGESSQGTPQIAIRFALLDGENIGKTITAFRFFSDRATQYAMKDLRTCGWTGDDVSEEPLPGVIGTEVELVLEEEEYEGKVRVKVKWINSPNGVRTGNPLDPKRRKALGAKLKGAAVASRSAAPPKTNGKPKDDVPF